MVNLDAELSIQELSGLLIKGGYRSLKLGKFWKAFYRFNTAWEKFNGGLEAKLGRAQVIASLDTMAPKVIQDLRADVKSEEDPVKLAKMAAIGYHLGNEPLFNSAFDRSKFRCTEMYRNYHEALFYLAKVYLLIGKQENAENNFLEVAGENGASEATAYLAALKLEHYHACVISDVNALEERLIKLRDNDGLSHYSYYLNALNMMYKGVSEISDVRTNLQMAINKSSQLISEDSVAIELACSAMTTLLEAAATFNSNGHKFYLESWPYGVYLRFDTGQEATSEYLDKSFDLQHKDLLCELNKLFPALTRKV
jgi:hypothetical protein